MSSDIKPSVFARGVPKAEKNGFYGIEQQLIENDETPIVAIVTYEVQEVMNKQKAGETYPIIATRHIEPLHDENAIAAALDLQRKAREARGDVELPLPAEPDLDLDSPLTDGEDD